MNLLPQSWSQIFVRMVTKYGNTSLTLPWQKDTFMDPKANFTPLSHKKDVMKKSALIIMALAGTAFCLDEYLPVEKNKIEVDLAYGFVNGTGLYDSAGKNHDFVSGQTGSGHAIPLQIKYGIIPGLDVELLWSFNIEKAGTPGFAPLLIPDWDTTRSGMGQPDIALKYALMDVGVGAYLDVALPFATGDFANPDQPPMALGFGAVYTKLFTPQLNLTAMAGYTVNFEAKDSTQAGNVISIYAKPEFRFNEFGGAYLGLKYVMSGERKLDGKSEKDSDGNLFTLLPGWNATWLPNVSTELNVPYTVTGKNTSGLSTLASWGINANVYYTFAM
jgi:hypothetical protein